MGVVVSSTFSDLQAHRAALIGAIEGQGMHAIAMEQDAALPDRSVLESSLEKVRDAAAYVGIISHIYGQIPECDSNPERLSLTELEFREARRLGQPILIFVMSRHHLVTVDTIERDPYKQQKLDAFRQESTRITDGSSSSRVYKEFHNLEDFTRAAIQSIAELRRHLDARASTVRLEQDGIPIAPTMYAEPPYIASHSFVGRATQLRYLDEWAEPQDPHPVMLLDAIGGSGKSMLTWEWFNNHAPSIRGEWAGRFWYSFYERGAVMRDFCSYGLAYMTGQPLKRLRKLRQADLIPLLRQELNSRPWLLVLDGLERVLVAYHRNDAAQLPDERAGITDEIANRNPCDVIRPQDEFLLRVLTTVSPSKVLVTSRLMPLALLNSSRQPLPGVTHRQLPGLDPRDAEMLLRTCGVHGDSQSMQNYLRRHCDCHPLVAGIVAGLINEYLPSRGSFDNWASDPAAGGALDIGNLNLVQKRNHILNAAIARLPDADRRLLSTLAVLSEAVDYPTLSALSPYAVDEPPEPPSTASRFTLADYQAQLSAHQISPEVKEAEDRLRLMVKNLEQRGLLQYDGQTSRFDLHPVVRSIAAGFRHNDHNWINQRVVDHFSARVRNPYMNAQTIDDVRNGLAVVRALLRMGRREQACVEYRRELAEVLLFNLEAYAEIVSILQPFFPPGWTAPPSDMPSYHATYLTTDVAMALVGLGELDQALILHDLSLAIDLNQEHWSNVRISLLHIAEVLDRQNRLRESERCLHLAWQLVERTAHPVGKFIVNLRMFSRAAESGRVDEAERLWEQINTTPRNWPRNQYRSGDAETRYVAYMLAQRQLREKDLVHAERLAREGSNRAAIRQLHAIRGEWLLTQRKWAEAAESLSEAIGMTRETGGGAICKAEAQLALARFKLDQLPDPIQEAARLGSLREPPHLQLAELLAAIGNSLEAGMHALAAYRYAWSDGDRYVRYYELARAYDLLVRLQVSIPELAATIAESASSFPHEVDVVAALDAFWP